MRSTSQSLVSRLVLSFLLPSLITLVLISTITFWRTDRALRDSVFERLEGIAAVKEAALDAWVEHLFRDIILLSRLPELVEAAAEIAEGVPAAASRPAARERLVELFEGIFEDQSNLTELALLAPIGGRILVSTDPAAEGEYRIYDRYYVEGKRAPFVQNVYPSPVTLQPTLTVSTPVRREPHGPLLGVLVAHLSLEYLDRNILQRTGLGELGGVTLVDQHRVVVTGQRYGGVEAASTETADSQAIEEVLQGRSGAGLYRDLAGEPVLGVYRWLEDRELGLLVEIRQREALAPARQLATSILVAGAVLLAALVVGIYVVARRIAKPILAITDAASRVREGDLAVRAPTETQDEIGSLARTFNRMVEQLASDAQSKREMEETREALIRELEAKNAELGQFTYTVSHDLKSPLLSIRGFLGYLERDLERGDLERARTDLRRVTDAAGRMERLLNDLLELSRAGRVIRQPQKFSFAELAREVAEAAERRRGNIASIEVEDGLPAVFGDPVRLREVLENLVGNAIKYMGDQVSPRVEIGLDRKREKEAFFVRDNGMGIALHYQEQIFGLFDRLDTSVEGTGVGLAIVRRIIEVHGGRIWVESAGEGQGSTFWFTLPTSAQALRTSQVLSR